jgi:hypothetical protein
MLDYFADAHAQGCCDIEIADSGFWLVAKADVDEFPTLAGTFGVQLSPTGLTTYANREDFMNAVALASLASKS